MDAFMMFLCLVGNNVLIRMFNACLTVYALNQGIDLDLLLPPTNQNVTLIIIVHNII